MNKESKLPFKWMPDEVQGFWLGRDNLSIQNLRSEWLWFRIQTVLSWKFLARCEVRRSGGCTLKVGTARAGWPAFLPLFHPMILSWSVQGSCSSYGILSQHHRASSPGQKLPLLDLSGWPVKLKTLWVNRGRANYDLQEQENQQKNRIIYVREKCRRKRSSNQEIPLKFYCRWHKVWLIAFKRMAKKCAACVIIFRNDGCIR